jgi:hypothetical protein
MRAPVENRKNAKATSTPENNFIFRERYVQGIYDVAMPAARCTMRFTPRVLTWRYENEEERP